MFSSFKGEGTGAVRHMFTHHILKPEIIPLEANLWGTHKSSGSFSTLFKSRILRALDYKDRPFELSLMNGIHGKSFSKEVHDLSLPMNKEIASTYDEFKDWDAVYLSCGNSSRTDILSESVDLVITDPPFFDNVHYSELADFFYVWLRKINGAEEFFNAENTRSEEEVQNVESRFVLFQRVDSVFSECSRLLQRKKMVY